jgi:DNA-binding IscR family transcriptional regulator
VASQVSTKDNLSNKEILSKRPALTIKEIASASKVSRQFMAGFLRALKEKGIITR